MNRAAPSLVLVLVTGLLLFYGNFSWSWAAGPVAALALWALERKAHEPAEPAPARAAVRNRAEPAPVD
ncbi:MAG TPA: hypothetical protein VI408_10745 [Gaiellaceae bacterium]